MPVRQGVLLRTVRMCLEFASEHWHTAEGYGRI